MSTGNGRREGKRRKEKMGVEWGAEERRGEEWRGEEGNEMKGV